eukprot:1560175-Rhodomonas_salina.3
MWVRLLITKTWVPWHQADRKTEGGNAGFNRLLYCLPAVVQAMSRFLLLPSYAKAMPSPVLT